MHYSFDSLSPGTIYDDSGFDNNGVINGRINITNRGKCGRAAKFTSAYVSLRNFKGTENVGTNSIAVMFWVKLLNQRSNSVILRGYYKGAVIELSLDRGFVKWRYITRDETTAFTLRHKRLLRPRRWTHIVGLYDPYSTIAKLYIDAKLASQSIVRKDLVDWRFTSWLTFGLKSSEGFLDDLYIYDCVLGKNIIENIKRNCGSEERCAPRGKSE